MVPHPDQRGAFREVWRASAFAPKPGDTSPSRQAAFVQANLSLSEAGVLRGLHYHRRQLDHWVVVEGEVFVALVDLRSGAGRPGIVTKKLGPDDTVTIPALVAHGFLALRRTMLLYFVTNEYDGSDEHGLAWDDPDVAIDWPWVETPDRPLIVSERDRANPSLVQARTALATPA